MRHQRARRTLGLVTSHRKAMLRNLVLGLIEHGRIRTTHARAKETSRFADRLITVAKKGTLHARRQLVAELRSDEAVKRVMDELAPLFKDQKGGYTRVMRFDWRPGDGAQMALLEFTQMLERYIPREVDPKEKKKSRKKTVKDASEPEVEVDEKAVKKSKVKKTTKEAKIEEADKSPEDTGEEGLQEEPRQGGFLGGLRKFLTGD